MRLSTDEHTLLNNDQAMAWTFCSIATVATAGRFYLRLRCSRLRQLKLDDLFNGLALACFITFCAAAQVYLVTEDAARQYQLSLALYLLLWSILYLVKASFLALHWYIFSVSVTFRRAWFVVAAYTFLSFWPVVILAAWQCGNPVLYDNPGVCDQYQMLGSGFVITAPAVDLALHISSDILILALPLVFIRKLQMSSVQKLSVAGVLVIAIVDILTGLLRNLAVLSYYLDLNVDVSSDLILFFQTFEPGLAVIVCAMPVYRVLLPTASARRISPMGLQISNTESSIATSKCNHSSYEACDATRESGSVSVVCKDWPSRR